MKSKLKQQLNGQKAIWLWVAYWRLWVVLMRIKLKQQSWLRSKISFVKDLPHESCPIQANYVSDMHEAIRLAARLHFLQAACLPRSIVLADMLSARGVKANVFLGVARHGERLLSHAWVAVNGQMVAEPESVKEDFTRL